MTIRIKEFGALSWVLDKDSIFTRRKKALISRDPLTKDLLKKLQEYRPNKNNPSEEEIENVKKELEKKWNVSILITGAAKPFVTGLPVIKDQVKEDCLSPVQFSNDGITIEEMEPLIIYNKVAGNPVIAFKPPCSGVLVETKINELIFHVNLSLLDNADAREMKKAFWSIIEKFLPKNKPDNEPGDIPEISFIYNIRQKTFDSYIRWYDLHFGNCLGFRTIAFLEKEIRNGNSDVVGLIGKLKSRRVPLGSKKSYAGEDRVEKGVKLIYRAIYRQEYSRRDRHELLEDYRCTEHPNNKCPSTCKYFQQWCERFNNALPEIEVGYGPRLKADIADPDTYSTEPDSTEE